MKTRNFAKVRLKLYLFATAGLPAAAQAAAGPGDRPAEAEQPRPRPDHLRALQLRQLQVGGNRHSVTLTSEPYKPSASLFIETIESAFCFDRYDKNTNIILSVLSWFYSMVRVSLWKHQYINIEKKMSKVNFVFDT